MYTKMSEKELSSRLKYFLDAGDSSWKSIPEATDANSRAPTDSAYLTRLEEQNTKIADFINILDASLDEKAEALLEEGDKFDSLKCRATGLALSSSRLTSNLDRDQVLGVSVAASMLFEQKESSLRALKELLDYNDEMDKSIEFEKNLSDELKTINSLLDDRIAEITDKEIYSLEKITEVIDQKNKELTENSTQQIKYLKELIGIIQTKIFDGYGGGKHGEEKKKNFSIMENLLNAMTGNEDRYVDVGDPDTPLVRLLLKGDMVIEKEGDPHFLKLRRYGMEYKV